MAALPNFKNRPFDTKTTSLQPQCSLKRPRHASWLQPGGGETIEAALIRTCSTDISKSLPQYETLTCCHRSYC